MVTPLENRDFYLWESYEGIVGLYYGMYLTFSEWQYWRVKSNQLRAYQTPSVSKLCLSPPLMLLNGSLLGMWHGLQGHEATGLGKANYSATSSAANAAPFRSRLSVVNPGTQYTTGVQYTGNQFFRLTNMSKIWADTTLKTAGFTGSTLCQTTALGLWSNPAIWSCGHVPYVFDDVLIKTPHVISITPAMGKVQCPNFEVQRGAVFTVSRVLEVGVR